MKILWLSIFCLLVSIPAFAIPQVGDYAAYTGYQNENGVRSKITSTMELVQKKGGSFLLKSTYKVGRDEVEEQEEWREEETLISGAQIRDMYKNCGSVGYGGERQDVRVPAGTFKTCRKNDGGVWSWIGNVPFGIVKLEYEDDLKEVEMRLESFRRGR